MHTIFMNSQNSKTSDPNKLRSFIKYQHLLYMEICKKVIQKQQI